MNTRIRKRGARYEVFLDLGEQDGQKCPACVDSRGRGSRHWMDSGRLEACPTCGGPLDDIVARRERWVGSFARLKDAQAKGNEALVASTHGEFVEGSKITVGQHFKSWADALTVKPSTALSYRGHIDKYIVPKLGYLRLQALTPRHVDRFYQELAKEPWRGTQKLSATTIRHIHVTLHSGLREAKRQRLVGFNAADDAKLPAIAHEKIGADKVWTVEQLNKFLNATENDRLGVMWQLMGTCGLRRGEACGLRWQDVDLDGAILHVEINRTSVGYQVHEGDPKSDAGKRMVPLLPITVAALRAWKARQNAEHLKWGAAWTESGKVFTNEAGEPLHPDRVSKLWVKTVAKVDVPRMRLHDLRHGFATMHIAAGTQAKHLQLLLGHSKIGVTLDTYVHPGDDDLAAAQAGLGAALAGKS